MYDKKIVKNKNIKIETYNGIIETKIFQKKYSETILADMGQPSIAEENKKIVMGEEEYTADYISMGNPHLVVYVDDPKRIQMKEWQEYEKVNVEFVTVLNRNKISMRVKERGTGETLACGTGACAAAVSCMKKQYVDNYVEVEMPGGNLFVEWEKDSNHIFAAGEAKTVFEGEVDICLP